MEKIKSVLAKLMFISFMIIGFTSCGDTTTYEYGPIALAGVDQTVEEGEEVSFDGSASVNPNGTIVSYEWEEVSDERDANDLLSNNISFSKNDFTAGTHTITLTITDNSGETSTDTMILTVTGSSNETPQANAGADQMIQEGTVVSFSGTASSDSDGSIVSYEWKESTTTLSTNSTFSKSDLSVGEHTIILTVTDNEGATDTDTMTVTITLEHVANIGPIANAGADQTVAEGTAVQFDGTASSDADGNIVSYSWKEGNTELSTNSTFTKSNLSAGSHTIELTVTDDDGLTSSDYVTITITEVDNVPPVAVAGADQSIEEGSSITLDGSASTDSDGNIVIYQWREGSDVLSNTVTYTVTDLAPGTYTYTLAVIDNDIASHTDEIVITVSGVVFESEEIVHNTFTYNTIQSPHTSKVWLDRNIGATQVCTSFDDAHCYGDYFQWGRETDDHENSSSATLTTLATRITEVGIKFILSTSDDDFDWTTIDSDGSQRSFNWDATAGEFACPVNFRVPTQDELKAETVNVGVSNREDAFDGFLKFPSAGYRDYEGGEIFRLNQYGYVWSSEPEGDANAKILRFHSTAADATSGSRASGRSVRCIKD